MYNTNIIGIADTLSNTNSTTDNIKNKYLNLLSTQAKELNFIENNLNSLTNNKLVTKVIAIRT